MLQKFKLFTVTKQLIVIASIMGFLNFIAVVFLDINASRAMRAITSVVVFIYFLYFLKCNSRWFSTILLLLVVSNLGLVFYGFDFGVLTYTMTSIIIYFLMFLKALLKIEWKKIQWLEYLAYSLIFVFNLCTFNYLTEVINPIFNEKWILYMIKLMGISGIVMCLFAGFYNTTRMSFKSAYHMYAAFGFVFSDFCAMLAFYFEMAPELFFFLDRALHLFGLYFLMRAAYMFQREQKKTISA